MEITEEQYGEIAHLFPKHRGNVRYSNLEVLNAVLYVLEHGCKWRGLPQRFGRWHTIYMRYHRWTEAGVWDRVFDELKKRGFIETKTGAVSVDSTTVKVHPDGTGARKSRGPQSNRPFPGWVDHQDSYRGRRRPNAGDL